MEQMLVNALHVKNAPGRKTDVKDCQWIVQLLAAGLLSPSLVPDRPQRELPVSLASRICMALTGRNRPGYSIKGGDASK